MANKPSPKGLHLSPLRRSIRKRIEEEDPQEEFSWDRLPLRFIVGKSIDKHINDPKFRLDNSDDEDTLELAVRGLIYRSVHCAQLDVYEAMRLCESPIERTMLGALITVAVKETTSIRFKSQTPYIFHGPNVGTHHARCSTGILNITPQAQLGEYRVDLLLEYEVTITTYPPETQEYDRNNQLYRINQPELGKDILITKDIIIECDGHDFHERTKAQAARDKKRDRILQSIGYNVFRFTGSEIYNDAITCAYEVFDSIQKAIRKQVPLTVEDKPRIEDQIEALIMELALLECEGSLSPKVKARKMTVFEKMLKEAKEDYEKLGGDFERFLNSE
jgi:hypothetical protein